MALTYVSKLTVQADSSHARRLSGQEEDSDVLRWLTHGSVRADSQRPNSVGVEKPQREESS